MNIDDLFQKIDLNEDLKAVLKASPEVKIAQKIEDLEDLACGAKGSTSMTVSYELPDGKVVDEVDVVRVRNGISANYREPYMRRRDPECMVIADDRDTDKVTFKERFGETFEELREESYEWLKGQKLAIFAFEMGQEGMVGDALAICPANAGFFALGLGLLQGLVDIEKMDRKFDPTMIVYVVPPFRHTHFNGKQVVVHNRGEKVHEIFSYNLYPGPSAKKGVYGGLIEKGEREGWVTAHCSAVQVVTPYDNIVSFMHEGASGGGKSEMLQQPHRKPDGRLCIGVNTVTGEERNIEINRTCDLHPVCDDMGFCHPEHQEDNDKLFLMDAENAWFIRVDHITKYGTDPDLENLTIHPKQPLLFLNIDVVEGGDALIWNHIEDAPGETCPNPRVILPRKMVPDIVEGKVDIDIRSFGVRVPACTKENPTYGIMGLVHVLPPALAWLWRLVSPRGHANPSIVDTGGMSSEGVGSYWPFATGKMINQANLLLEQIRQTNRTKYLLIPNQHIGAWKTGFMPQWLVRDYFARRGHARFRDDQLIDSRCSLLGYSMKNMRIEGVDIPHKFLQVENQPEIGIEAYDAGAKILETFFHSELAKFNKDGIDPIGKKIIECCLSGGSVKEYSELLGESNE